MCRKKNFSTGNWRTLWKDFFPQPIHPHSTAPVDTRRVAADNAHVSFLQIVTSLTRPPGCPRCQFRTGIFCESLLPLQCPVSLPGGNRGSAPKPPLPKGGASATPRRGDDRLAGFHMGLCLWKVPAVESLSRLRRQLPLAREPFCARYRSMVRYRAFTIFQSTAWERSAPKTTTQNGGRG